jgi:hypothetical protein
MKLEVGKYYKRGDGLKVFAMGMFPTNLQRADDVCVYVYDNCYGYVDTYCRNGKYLNDILDVESDIVSEWEDEEEAFPLDKYNNRYHKSPPVIGLRTWKDALVHAMPEFLVDIQQEIDYRIKKALDGSR